MLPNPCRRAKPHPRAVLLAQRVQLQLKSAEQTSKDDASPVTIADYGVRQSLGLSSTSHPTRTPSFA